jgi:HEAT repeat protein
LLVLLACAVAVAQPEGISKDIREVDDRAAKPFEQREREAAMRRLGESDDEAALAKLVTLLGDDFVHIRASAQRILIGAAPAADALLKTQGLADRNAEVRRRSARVLGARRHAGAISQLAAMARADSDEETRVAAAEALGAIAGAATGDQAEEALAGLSALLKANNAAAGAAARELGRLGQAAHADAIARILRSKSAEAVIGACDGLAALGVAADRADALAGVSDHKDWGVRIASVQALCAAREVGDEELYRKTLGQRLADKDWRVRRRTIEALVDLWHPLSAELLIQRIEQEEGALAIDIVHALEDLTGTRQGYRAAAWAGWWKASGRAAGITARKPRPKHGWLRPPRDGSAESGGSGATASYFDIPVFSRPTAFVFDMSGSMREAVSRDNAKIRIDLARQELARTLERMPDGSSLNLVIYRYYSEFPIRTELQRAFPKGVQPHSQRTVESATRWINTQEAVGWGAFYEGITGAMEDPQVEAVYFLSDGAPSRGEYVDREALIEALGRARRFSPVIIHGVLVGGGNRDEQFMREMSESCGGEFADTRKAK